MHRFAKYGLWIGVRQNSHKNAQNVPEEACTENRNRVPTE